MNTIPWAEVFSALLPGTITTLHGIAAVLVWFGALLFMFLAVRGVVLWYLKINRIIELLERIEANAGLDRIDRQTKPTQTTPPR